MRPAPVPGRARIRSRRRSPAPALVAIAAVLGTPSIGVTTPSCTTSSLVLWAEDHEGAPGSVYRTLELTSQSGHTCVLFGYRGVSAVDLHGLRARRARSDGPYAVEPPIAVARALT